MKSIAEIIESASTLQLKKLRDIIPPSQREVLEVLIEFPRSTAKEISQKLNKPYQQISRDLNSLIKKGIVTFESGKGKTKYYMIRDRYLDMIFFIVVEEYIRRAYNSAISLILSDPNLTPRQKDEAIKHFDKNLEEKLPDYLNKITKEAIQKALKEHT